jgi:UDP-2,3-diacylglucosamine pyrophosphatase LpxH
MNRRWVFKILSVSSLSLGIPQFLKASGNLEVEKDKHSGSFSLDGNVLRFIHPDIQEAFAVTMIADTHLFRDDARGEAYKQYSARMARAYNETRHFQTGETINPEIGFEGALAAAVENKSSLIALVGDIFSFPSEAAIEWVEEKMNSSGIPYLYTAGNHDWHYEGMEGTSDELRETWISKRLSRFYQGRNPMMQMAEVHGVKFIFIDNSTYEINQEQLDFLNLSLADGSPAVLMVHIPLYAPGRSVWFGCGHPDWNAANDTNFKLERRLPWREEGHTRTTLDFYNTVFESKNILGVLAGHIHNQSVDIINGIPQIVTESNAEGGFLQVRFGPMS